MSTATKYLKFEDDVNNQVNIDKCEILVYYENKTTEQIITKHKFGNEPYTGLLPVSNVPPAGAPRDIRNITIPFPSNYKPLSVLFWSKDYFGTTSCSETQSFRISSSLTSNNKFSFSLKSDNTLNLNFPVNIKNFGEMGVANFNRGSCPNTTSLVGKIVILYDKSQGDILKQFTVENGKKYDSESVLRNDKKEIEYYSNSRYIGIL